MTTKLFLLLWLSEGGLGVFMPGRVQEGPFEYSDINGWMTPSEARDRCEEDLQCGGFTFKGSLTDLVTYEMYFFHYVEKVRLESEKTSRTWSWMSYRVSRGFLVLHRKFTPELEAPWQTLSGQHHVNLSSNPSGGLDLCQSLDICVAVSQDRTNPGEVLVHHALHFQYYDEDPDWTTVVSLAAHGEWQMQDDTWDLDTCCPETPPIPYIDDHVEVERELPRQSDQQMPRVSCDISAEQFLDEFIRKRSPVVLVGCFSPDLVDNNRENPTFGGLNFDQILADVWHGSNTSSTQRSRPKLRRRLIEMVRSLPGQRVTYNDVLKLYDESVKDQEEVKITPTWTHDETPNDANLTMADLLEGRREGDMRVFLKSSSKSVGLGCYEKYRILGSTELREGYQSCLILDGLWKPEPFPRDLYELTKYNNDIGWIIMSAKNTGSQIHVDPDLMGAWNALLLGRKWWAIFPYEVPETDLTCSTRCSPGFDHVGHVWPWFMHILPQLRGKKYYGRTVMEYVQQPGEVLFLPNGMAHTIFNIDDNVALTENYLFPDTLPGLVRAMACDHIHPYVPTWNEGRAYKNIYMKYATKEDRVKMREMYDQITTLIRRFPDICDDSGQ